MATDTMPSAINMAFRTALLLTGDTRTDEAAVVHGIGACEDLSPGSLQIEAVRSAVRRRTKSSDGPYEVEWLPTELRRLFMLQPLFATLLRPPNPGASLPEVCAELLEISVTRFEDALYEALTELTLLA